MLQSRFRSILGEENEECTSNFQVLGPINIKSGVYEVTLFTGLHGAGSDLHCAEYENVEE